MTRQPSAAQAIWKSFRAKVLERKFARNVGALTSANLVVAGVNLIQAILVARLLGPKLYGVAALVMSYPALVYTFFDARSSEASVKYLNEFNVRGEQDRVLAMCKLGYVVDLAIASFAFLAALTTASWAAKNIAHRPEAITLIVVYAAAFVPRSLTGTSRAVLTSLEKFPAMAKIDLFVGVARAGLVIGLVLAGYQVAGVIWGNALAMGVNGLIYCVFAFVLVQRTWGMSWLKGKFRTLKGQRREIFGFLAFNNLSVLVSMIPKQLDIVLLGYFRNPTDAGYYKLAKSLARVMGLPIAPLQSVTYQRMVSISSHPLKLREFAKRIMAQIGIPLGLINLAGIIVFPILVVNLVGDKYGPSVPAVQLWVVAYTIWFLFFWLRSFYFAKGWMAQWFSLNVVASLFFIIAGVPLVATAGFIGLTAARVSYPLIVHLGGITLLFYLLRDEMKKGWRTKARRKISVEKIGTKRIKILESFSTEHAKFIASVICEEKLSPYFPRLVSQPCDSTLKVEWVKGKHVKKPTNEILVKIARFQALLHNHPVGEREPGFDYTSFIVSRVVNTGIQISERLQSFIDELANLLSALQSGRGLAVSHPDISPDNLICSQNGFKIIDLELLSVHRLYFIDLLNVCYTFGLKGSSLQVYVEAYKAEGGDLTLLVDYWDYLMALWTLRNLAAALESNNVEQPIAFLERNKDSWRETMVGFEPELLEVALRCV